MGTGAGCGSAACVGEEIFTSWFARMEIEGVEGDTVKLSVPTRFLKSWVQSHYAERLLGCWQDELPAVTRIELTVRSAVLRAAAAEDQAAEAPPAATDRRDIKLASDIRARGRADLRRARRARRLPARSAPDLRDLRGRPIQHAGARRRQAGGAGPARRRGDVQSALHPCRRRARQDAPAAVDRLGRQRRGRTQGALSDRGKVHVRLRRRAAGAERARVQGGAARRSTCW